MKITDIKVKDKIHLFYNEGNINNKIYHVRALVDDMLCVRYWSRKKKRWFYDFIEQYELDMFPDIYMREEN